MIAHKGLFYRGLGLLVAFFIVLFLMFMPLIQGHNFLNYMDNLYNTISKGSAYYIPKLKNDISAYQGKTVVLEFGAATEREAEETGKLFQKSGAQVGITGAKMKISGDLGMILANCLEDSDLMFHNKGDQVAAKYGYSEKQALYNWWQAAKKMDKELKHQKMFQEAKMVASVQGKAIECAYNYYKIVPENIKDKVGIVIFSLVFYVFYTLWFGFSIMFLFEGWGMRLEH